MVTSENRDVPETQAVSAEIASVTASGNVTVSWSVDKQMNDIWRAFDEIRYIVFTVWRSNKDAAKKAVEAAARQKIGSGGRYYPTVPGQIQFKDDGSYTIMG